MNSFLHTEATGFTVIAILLGFLALRIIYGVAHRSPGKPSARAFQDLGDIRGMPMASIIKKVGPPNSISASGDGQLYQWISAKGRRGFHYAIIADSDDNAVGYTHQFVH